MFFRASNSVLNPKPIAPEQILIERPLLSYCLTPMAAAHPAAGLYSTESPPPPRPNVDSGASEPDVTARILRLGTT
jgi:hypothetical protein